MKTIKEALENIVSKTKVRAAMPGHKGRLAVDPRHDVTELPGMDNLHNPAGVIQSAQERAADIYCVASARYLVNGSSGGNLTMIFSFFTEGDEILVERTCHKSVYNALVLRKLKPVYLWPKLDEYGSTLPVTAVEVEEALQANRRVKGVFLTQPSYKGLVSDLGRIFDVCRNHRASLLIDAAHGAALAGMEAFKDFYQSADAMVVSTHKSLACLNQGAVLLNNRAEYTARILKYSNMFQTTSPSYLIMSSIESSLEELAEGEYLSGPGIDLSGFTNLTVNPRQSGFQRDPWKILVILKDQGGFMEDFLESRGIYPEFHDEHSVLFMLSPKNSSGDLQRIQQVLMELDDAVSEILEQAGGSSDMSDRKTGTFEMPAQPVKVFELHETGEDFEEVRLKDTAGRIAFEQVTPYPPGIPLLLPGERIDGSMADYIERLERMNIEIIGMHGGKLRCLTGGDGTWAY